MEKAWRTGGQCRSTNFPKHPSRAGLVEFMESKELKSEPWIVNSLSYQKKDAKTWNSSGWWFRPLWKILVNWDDYSQSYGQIKNVPNHKPVIMEQLLANDCAIGMLAEHTPTLCHQNIASQEIPKLALEVSCCWGDVLAFHLWSTGKYHIAI